MSHKPEPEVYRVPWETERPYRIRIEWMGKNWWMHNNKVGWKEKHQAEAALKKLKESDRATQEAVAI